MSVEHARQLVEDAHSLGHFGTRAVHAQLAALGWSWPGMATLIRDSCADCSDCQQWNSSKRIFHPTRPMTACFPWDAVQVDLVSSLDTDTLNMKYLLVITDVFTSFSILRALPSKSADIVAGALWQIFCDVGPPRLLQSDNGTEFVNETIAALHSLFGNQHRTITAYNPRSAGVVEKHGHIASMTIRKLAGAIRPWSTVVPLAQLAMNCKIKNSTNASPFALFFNRTVNGFQSYLNDGFAAPTAADRESWTKREIYLHTLIFPRIHDRQQKLKARHNIQFKQSQMSSQELAVGTIVYVLDPLTPRNKNSPPFTGPYTIAAAQPGGLYSLRDSTGGMFHRSVTRDMIKVRSSAAPSPIPTTPASSSSSSSSAPTSSAQPGPVSISPVDPAFHSYRVDELVDHRYVDGQLQYRVRWHGWSLQEASWEPAHNIEDLDLIRTVPTRILSKSQSNCQPALYLQLSNALHQPMMSKQFDRNAGK